MTQEQYFKNLAVPSGMIDVVLDTDAYNEIDDQFAICYLLKASYKCSVKGICAAPFLNKRVESVEDGMRKSYYEIMKLLKLANMERMKDRVYRGSDRYLPAETVPVDSEAAEFMATLAENYSPEKPLYIVALGAITNVASAILKNPKMTENCVVIWLGGHATHIQKGASEFNMKQDIAAARVVMGSGIPLVQLPCKGVVDRFATTKYELRHWIQGKNALCDYLFDNTVEYMRTANERPWSKSIWDVTAVAWLLNDDQRFMRARLIHSPIPEYDLHYAFDENRYFIQYVYEIHRDDLFADLFNVLGACDENL